MFTSDSGVSILLYSVLIAYSLQIKMFGDTTLITLLLKDQFKALSDIRIISLDSGCSFLLQMDLGQFRKLDS